MADGVVSGSDRTGVADAGGGHMDSGVGSRRRLGRIIPPNQPAVWLPIDDALITGPEHFLRNPKRLLSPALIENLTAVLGFGGILSACQEELAGIPFIMNLSGSTMRGEHTRKVDIARVTDAVRVGADAVAYHINVTSPFEEDMLHRLGILVSEANALGMPVVAIAYPRGRAVGGEDDNYIDLRTRREDEFAGLVRHCARIAVELGVSAVKTIFTGSADSFSTVVDASCGIPVLIAGEEFTSKEEAIWKARAAVRAGAAGVAFGRQIFQRDDPKPFVVDLKLAVTEEWQRTRY